MLVVLNEEEKEEVKSNSEKIGVSMNEYFRMLHKKFGNKLVEMFENEGIFDKKALEIIKKKLFED